MSEWLDEGPSESDLERFNHQEEGYCPECGAVVYDDAEFCPDCGQQIGGRISNKPPAEKEIQNRLTIIIVVIVLLGFLSWLIF
ncbi:MAG: zinc ribbon domain-containing protein [Phycisphaerales bacterium]|nr:zinc ribbon domain-containing protein [Phycisphaerales bacterium]